MYRQGIADFPYYLGIRSLADVARSGDRVCVLNIMGGESRTVTPTSHVFSGGNVAFGTSPGRAGQKLKTPIGDIPVFNNVREGLDAGLAFNVGVVYLPPSGVRDGVAELIRVNDALEKIVIITEKIAVHDAREIRAMAQANGVDDAVEMLQTGETAGGFLVRAITSTSIEVVHVATSVATRLTLR
jgi:succinyl-CoA synthetase alpha subunit